MAEQGFLCVGKFGSVSHATFVKHFILICRFSLGHVLNTLGISMIRFGHSVKGTLPLQIAY